MKKILIIMLAAAGIIFGLTKANLLVGKSIVILAEEEVDGGEGDNSKPPSDNEKPEETPDPIPDPKPEPKPDPKPDPKPEPKPDPKPKPKPKPKPSTKPKTDNNSITNSTSKNTASNSRESSGKSSNNRQAPSTNQPSQQRFEQAPTPHTVQEEPVIYEPEEVPVTEPIEEEVENRETEEDSEEDMDEEKEETKLDIHKLKQLEVMIRQEDGKFYVIYKDDDDNVVKQEITKEEAIELGYEDNQVVEKEDEQVGAIDLISNSSNSKMKKIFGMIAVILVSCGLMAGTYLYYRKKVA